MRGAAVGISLILACCAREPAHPERRSAQERPHATPTAFLRGRLAPWPPDAPAGLIAVTDPRSGRAAVYDSALVALVLLRRGHRDEAGRVLAGLAALQAADGSLPFSFTLPTPDAGGVLVRSGAIAWVGYAATEYLDAERGGRERERVAALAHRAASYLIAHVVDPASGAIDPRAGLVRGGWGSLRYEVSAAGVREILVPGEIAWTSTEHNVDAFFFFRALARVTSEPAYAAHADRIARSLSERAWLGTAGQLAQGLGADGADRTLALDCASWASAFFGAAADAARQETAFSVADGRYASFDPSSPARGHRPYTRGPLIGDPAVLRRLATTLPALTWDRLEGVWPEGSAGVAFAALRAGRRERARAILDALEPLRRPNGALPSFTTAIPYSFDTDPSIAGTAWVELVRFELARPDDRPTLWAP